MSVRFQFGRNWRDYLSQISQTHLRKAQESFQAFTGLHRLENVRFLDLGCGSGVHSWAAWSLGAKDILSFDYDIHSVEACRQLKQDHAPDAAYWTVRQGDVLDTAFIHSLGAFDYVYSWGVLHHTGNMWTAIENAMTRVAPGGRFHIALYNRHWSSPLWGAIKWTYVHSPGPLQKALLYGYAGLGYARGWVRHRGDMSWIARYAEDRGMLWFNNLHDWLGGYPYEYATPDEIKEFFARHGFNCLNVVPNRGTGCSEFLFQRKDT